MNIPETAQKTEHTIWNIRAYDFNVRTHKALLQKLDYCYKNPLTRGLVDCGEEWPWSMC